MSKSKGMEYWDTDGNRCAQVFFFAPAIAAPSSHVVGVRQPLAWLSFTDAWVA
jgi:hypothetical protein